MENIERLRFEGGKVEKIKNRILIKQKNASNLILLHRKEEITTIDICKRPNPFIGIIPYMK